MQLRKQPSTETRQCEDQWRPSVKLDK